MSDRQPTITYDPSELLKRCDPAKKLEQYYQLLLEENKRVNLVSRETGIGRVATDGAVRCPHLTASKKKECRVGAPDTTLTSNASFIKLKKLAAQSLLPFEKIDIRDMDNYLDIGSGGGFPAIPILLTRKIKQTCLLVERRKKKAGALRRILLALEIKATIIDQSFEETSLEPAFDLITLRLVKLTPKLFNRIFFLLRPGGYFVYYAAPDFDLTGKGANGVTYHHSTSSGEETGRFTIFRKKFSHQTF